MRIGLLAPAPRRTRKRSGAGAEWYQPLKAEGAVLVEVEPPKSFTQMEDAEPIVLMWEFKAAINDYLQRLAGPRRGDDPDTDLIAFNRAHDAQEMPLFGQDIFEDADKLGAITSPAYRQARDHLMKLADTAGTGEPVRAPQGRGPARPGWRPA